MWFECIYAVIWVICTLQLHDVSETGISMALCIENVFFSLYREKCKDPGAGSLQVHYLLCSTPVYWLDTPKSVPLASREV